MALSLWKEIPIMLCNGPKISQKLHGDLFLILHKVIEMERSIEVIFLRISRNKNSEADELTRAEAFRDHSHWIFST